MARSRKEAIVVVLDIGAAATKHVLPDGSSFMQASKKCLERIIERKIFSSGNDEIAVVLIGDDESKNTLGYEFISVGFDLAKPSWFMIRNIHELQGTDIEQYDWIDGLVVALDVMRMQTEGKKFMAKKIVLLVYPDNNATDDKLDTIIFALKEMKIEMTAIGVELFSEEEEDGAARDGGAEADVPMERGECLMKTIISETGGVACMFEEALSELKMYQARKVYSNPWNIMLEIGHSIKIPVSLYKKIGKATQIVTWKKKIKEFPKYGETSQSQQSRHGTVVDEERVYMRDDMTLVDKENLISGYYFGSSTVPFNEFDRSQLRYKSGQKCLNILGFVGHSEVPRHLFIGDALYYLLPQKKFPESQSLLSALIQALHDQKKVAVATKVYRLDSKPHLVGLFPLLKKKFKCLMVVELPFSENVKEFVFPRVVPANDEPNEEDLQAVDGLIDAMDLMAVDRDGEQAEAFRPKDTLDPALNHQFRCIAHRALEPKAALPAVSDDIKQLMACPFLQQDKFLAALAGFKVQFGIAEQLQMTSLKKELQQVRENELARLKADPSPKPSTSREPGACQEVKIEEEISMTKHTLVEVGSIRPHLDFTELVKRGQPFPTVCAQMQRVITKLVLTSFGSDSFPKALLALATLRTACVGKDPAVYNDWLPAFKDTLDERDKMKFWELVAQDRLGLITREESADSCVSPEEAAELWKRPLSPAAASGDDGDMDIDDLIGEM